MVNQKFTGNPGKNLDYFLSFVRKSDIFGSERVHALSCGGNRSSQIQISILCHLFPWKASLSAYIPIEIALAGAVTMEIDSNSRIKLVLHG
jgi:hypothetical protein